MRRPHPRARRGPAARGTGFTLVELLVVLVILGTLAAVAVVAVSQLGDRASTTACASDARAVTAAEQSHRTVRGAYGTEAELVAAGFLAGESTLHDVTLSADGFTVVATGSCAGDEVVLAAFGADDGTSLDGLSADTGQTWTALAGGWSVLDGAARSDGSRRSVAVVDTGADDASVGVSMRLGAKANAGLALDAGDAGYFSVAIVQGKKGKARVDIVRHTGRTARVERVRLPARVGPDVELRVEARDGSYTASVDGTVVVDYEMSPADHDLLAGGSAWGLYAHRDATTTFDDFRVD